VKTPPWVRLVARTRGPARLTLIRLWARRLLLPDPPPLPAGITAAPHVLFVCHGNILRSAVAEALFARLAGAGLLPTSTAAASAGLHATEGKPADPRGINVAAELGLNLEGHRARRVTGPMVDAADLVIVMDRINEAEIVSRYHQAAPKIRLLGTFGDDGTPAEVPDPFMGDEEAVRQAFRRIDECLRSLAALIRPPPGSPS
jgi:protein-tyrosine-phosphatase